MAALSDASSPVVAPLRAIRASQLEALLAEETAVWRAELAWDFSPSAELVRRFVHMQALNGHALLVGEEAVGYEYFVFEEHKGLIGDLYVRREMPSEDWENALMAAAVREMMESPFLRRIEAQLMMLRQPLSRALPNAEFLRAYPRNFMSMDLRRAGSLQPGKAAARADIFEWSDGVQEEAARLIALAYQGHVDGEINDQYRSVQGARRFLMNIIQYPGCGVFFQPASFLAFEPGSGRLVGLCLSSLVAQDAGHVTQVCVAPDWQGRGLGYELMRRAIQTLAHHGCRQVSLTVTASNTAAVELYQSIGFQTLRQFAAYVWEGF